MANRQIGFKPKYKTCLNCGGKKWFPSAIGLIACSACNGTGKGGIDVEWLLKDWQRLKALDLTGQTGQSKPQPQHKKQNE